MAYAEYMPKYMAEHTAINMFLSLNLQLSISFQLVGVSKLESRAKNA